MDVGAAADRVGREHDEAGALLRLGVAGFTPAGVALVRLRVEEAGRGAVLLHARSDAASKASRGHLASDGRRAPPPMRGPSTGRLSAKVIPARAQKSAVANRCHLAGAFVRAWTFHGTARAPRSCGRLRPLCGPKQLAHGALTFVADSTHRAVPACLNRLFFAQCRASRGPTEEKHRKRSAFMDFSTLFWCNSPRSLFSAPSNSAG